MNSAAVHRKLHRWGSILTAIPLLLIIATGVLLQFKKESVWIQPPTVRGEGKEPVIAFDEILARVKGVPEAEVAAWNDVDRLDVRPGKGVIKVRCKNRWEIQIDAKTGDVLQSAYRRSDLIESLHDGTFFSDKAKLWIFFPAAIVLLVMWVTGIWLFLLPYFRRKK